MNYSHLTGQEMIDLLFTEEDRLPRAAVDEFVRRGDRMVGPLAEIVSKNFNWTKEWWIVIHAVFILGAIGTEETVIPLLKSLRFSCAYDCDWVNTQLASIFGKVGIKAIDGLKLISSDYTTGWFARTVAMEALAAITISAPETEKDIFAFIGAVFLNKNEDKDVRAFAGNILLDFQKEEFKTELLDFGRNERRLKDKDMFYNLVFAEDDARKAFNLPEKDLRQYKEDWLDFYDEEQIRERQERWEKEDEKRLREEKEEETEYRELSYPGVTPFAREGSKVGRNAPCPCGSGKKFKKCCGK
ncbi:MAG: SEC-C metal-binding domain-containing protein [Candidatus Omnitrophota bacterium]